MCIFILVMEFALCGFYLWGLDDMYFEGRLSICGRLIFSSSYRMGNSILFGRLLSLRL